LQLPFVEFDDGKRSLSWRVCFYPEKKEIDFDNSGVALALSLLPSQICASKKYREKSCSKEIELNCCSSFLEWIKVTQQK